MKEAIGGTWLMQLAIFFILLFAGYMCLSINYTRAFNVKDKIINEIERNGGIKKLGSNVSDDKTLKAISRYMKEVGYRVEGQCGSDYDYGCNRDGNCTAINDSSSTFAFCLKEVDAGNTYTAKQEQEFLYVRYYKVKVFYHLDLPVIRSVFNFDIKGDTKLLYKLENASNRAGQQ